MDNAIKVLVKQGAQTAPCIYTTKVLKPNIDGEGNNVLDPEELQNPNTKYVIRWSYTLEGKTITIPKGCLLEFDGGSLKNGTLIGNETYIISYLDIPDIMKNINLEGSYKYSIFGPVRRQTIVS